MSFKIVSESFYTCIQITYILINSYNLMRQTNFFAQKDPENIIFIPGH